MYRNLAREYSTTTGTSDCVLSGAVPGCNTWEDAGVANSEIVRYGIITYSTSTHRPTHSEIGVGSYNTATNTLARTTVESSTNSGSKITLTGLSEVYICPTRKDLPIFAAYYGSLQTVNNATSNTVLGIDTEQVDDHGLATLATNVITVNYPCWLEVYASISYSGASAFNGSVHIEQVQYGISTRRGYTTAMSIQSDSIFVGPLVFNVTTTQAISFEIDNALGVNVDAIVNDVVLKAHLK